MKHIKVIIGVTLLGLFIHMYLNQTVEAERTVTILAAASLSPALEQVEKKLEAEFEGMDIRIVSNGSGALRAQINQGSPADIFLAASEEDVRHLSVPILERHAFLTNELWLVTPKAGRCTDDFRDLENCGRIVIGDPVNVPAGRYAKKALESAQIWNHIEPKTMFAQNVRQVLTLVEQGDVDVGFVYKTELTSKVNAIQTISVDATGPIRYPAVRLSHQPGVAEVYDRLFDQDIQQYFLDKGFSK